MPEPAGTLAIGVLTWADAGGPAQELVILADGRVIDPLSSADGIVTRRRLTVEGMAWLEDQLEASGLFTKDRTLKPALLPGATPYPGPGAGDAIQLAVDDRLITVRRNLFELGVYVSTPEIDRFESLLQLLQTLPDSIPEALWAEMAPVPYIAATDELCISVDHMRVDPAYRSPIDWALVTWPMHLDPGTWGTPDAEYSAIRCAPIDFQLALQVEVAGADAREPGPLLEAGAYAVGFDFDWAAEDATVSLSLGPILPGQTQ